MTEISDGKFRIVSHEVYVPGTFPTVFAKERYVHHKIHFAREREHLQTYFLLSREDKLQARRVTIPYVSLPTRVCQNTKATTYLY